MNLDKIAQDIKDTKEDIILVYAFNSSGKTRLSVAYKDLTKRLNHDKHAGVYYNAFSEDLFQWHNDIDNGEIDKKLNVVSSSLNQFHSFIMDDEKRLAEKLESYNPRYTFELSTYKTLDGVENREAGIKSIYFYHKDDEAKATPIKISRGEERIFVWCFFLALFEIDGWVDEQDAHFFIDDPVSSLDDHNIFITADSIFDIIEKSFLKKKRIIVTTHHIGLFSILADRLTKGGKSGRYTKNTKIYTLSRKGDITELKDEKNDVFLFHLHLMKTLYGVKDKNPSQYYFVLLRQLLENISSFLGIGRMSYVLSQIGFSDIKKDDETETESERIANRINGFSHKDSYRFQHHQMSPDEVKLFIDILDRIQAKYKFVF